MSQIISPYRSLAQRYDDFCSDALELLEQAGLANPDQNPTIVGKAFLDACNRLSDLHFPEDKQVNGHGPRGMIWSMYSSVDAPTIKGHTSDPLMGTKAIAYVIKKIIKYRPPLDIERNSKFRSVHYDNVHGNAYLGYNEKIDPKTVFILMNKSFNADERKSLIQSLELKAYKCYLCNVEKFSENSRKMIVSKIMASHLVILDSTFGHPILAFAWGASMMNKTKIIITKQKTEPTEVTHGFDLDSRIYYADMDDLAQKLIFKLELLGIVS